MATRGDRARRFFSGFGSGLGSSSTALSSRSGGSDHDSNSNVASSGGSAVSNTLTLPKWQNYWNRGNRRHKGARNVEVICVEVRDSWRLHRQSHNLKFIKCHSFHFIPRNFFGVLYDVGPQPTGAVARLWHCADHARLLGRSEQLPRPMPATGSFKNALTTAWLATVTKGFFAFFCFFFLVSTHVSRLHRHDRIVCRISTYHTARGGLFAARWVALRQSKPRGHWPFDGYRQGDHCHCQPSKVSRLSEFQRVTAGGCCKEMVDCIALSFIRAESSVPLLCRPPREYAALICSRSTRGTLIQRGPFQASKFVSGNGNV